jgi:hypothetical protein
MAVRWGGKGPAHLSRWTLAVATAAVIGAWILATGFWDDGGVWDDTASWID